MKAWVLLFLIPQMAWAMAPESPLFFVVHAYEREDFRLQSRIDELFRASNEWSQFRRVGLINEDYPIKVPAYEAALTDTVYSAGGEIEPALLRSARVSMSGGFAQLCFAQAVRDVVNYSSHGSRYQQIEILADYVYVQRASQLESFNFYFVGFLTENERQQLRLAGTTADVVENFPQLMHMRVKTPMQEIRQLADPARDGLMLILRDLYDLKDFSFRAKENGLRGHVRLVFDAHSKTNQAIELSVRLCPAQDCR